VILSQYPCFSMFEAVLHEVQIRWQNWNACKAFLFEVLAQPLPEPGGRIEIATVSWREPGAIDNLVFTRPSATDALFDYVNFEPMLRECDAACIVTLFSSLLVERRVVFTSDSLEALSAVVNAALALLRPLQWQYIFIPLLPKSMVGFCSSPIPFVVGLLNSSLEALRKEPHESLVLLDIDNGEFLTETPDTDLIPLAERDKLLNAVKLAQQKLKRNKHLTQGDARAMCDIFLAFFAAQLSGWRNFYRDNRLQVDEFASQRSDPRAKRLTTSMCSSQMFTQFAAKYSDTDDSVAWSSADGFVSALEQANSDVHGSDHAKPSRRQQLWRLKRLERGGADGPPLAGHHADDEPEEVVFKQGWLNKLSGKRKGKWERRWFKLTANKLVWYKTRTDAKESGSVFLPDVTYITDRYKGHVGKEHCMELVTRGRTHYIYADSTAELAEWYPHIQMLCVSSTTFQEPDERSALALASSLSLVPTEYVDSANASGSSSPLRTLSNEAPSGSAVRSKLASFLKRGRDAPQKTHSTPPMPPPNPFARNRATSATTVTNSTTASTAQASAPAPAPVSFSTPTSPTPSSTTSAPHSQSLTNTIATATALMAQHRLGAYHKLTTATSAPLEPLPDSERSSPATTTQSGELSLSAVAASGGADHDDDSSDLSYSHTESSDSGSSGDSGSDEPLPKLPSATALAASAKMRVSPMRIPPVPHAPPPNKLERSRSSNRSASVNFESSYSSEVRRDSSPPPSPSGLNPTAAAAVAASTHSSPLLSSLGSSPQPPVRRPPPVPVTQPPPVLRKSSTSTPTASVAVPIVTSSLGNALAASPPSPLNASPAAAGSPAQ
jgi:hypothetical protein